MTSRPLSWFAAEFRNLTLREKVINNAPAFSVPNRRARIELPQVPTNELWLLQRATMLASEGDGQTPRTVTLAVPEFYLDQRNAFGLFAVGEVLDPPLPGSDATGGRLFGWEPPIPALLPAGTTLFATWAPNDGFFKDELKDATVYARFQLVVMRRTS